MIQKAHASNSSHCHQVGCMLPFDIDQIIETVSGIWIINQQPTTLGLAIVPF